MQLVWKEVKLTIREQWTSTKDDKDKSVHCAPVNQYVLVTICNLLYQPPWAALLVSSTACTVAQLYQGTT